MRSLRDLATTLQILCSNSQDADDAAIEAAMAALRPSRDRIRHQVSTMM
jgi:hypothetical protein